VLGEARLLNIEAKESVAAYEKALALRPNDQTIISVSVDAAHTRGTTACSSSVK
jgi:cytochrome c-type biogenesis protein CcmH/NrfG